MAIERFLAKVNKSTTNGCWLWVGAMSTNGYGHFSLNRKITGSHRAAWRLFNGSIPDGYQVCHKCDVRCCVNPGHLFLGTQKDNIQDMVAKGRAAKPDVVGPLNPMFGRSHSEDSRLLQSLAKQHRYVGTNHPRASINEKQVKSIKEMRVTGATANSIAESLGISFHIVRNVIYRKSWKHI
jgi:HNH endonuclease